MEPTPVTPTPIVNPAPVAQAPAPQTVTQAVAPAKSTPVWAWILGGCLGIIILLMVAVGGFTWWAAKKISNEVRDAEPNLEQFQKGAEKLQKQAEEWQKQAK